MGSRRSTSTSHRTTRFRMDLNTWRPLSPSQATEAATSRPAAASGHPSTSRKGVDIDEWCRFAYLTVSGSTITQGPAVPAQAHENAFNDYFNVNSPQENSIVRYSTSPIISPC